MKPTPKQRIWMYEMMLKSRLFDDAVFEAYWEGKKPVFHMGKGPLPGEMTGMRGGVSLAAALAT